MSLITQYILGRGLSEDVFIFLLAVPAILALALCFRQIIGLPTPKFPIILLLVFLTGLSSLTYIGFLFAIVFISIALGRYLLKQSSFLTQSTSFIVRALSLCLLIVVLLFIIAFMPFLEIRNFNSLALLSVISLIFYSQSLIPTLETKGLKKFIAPFLKSISVIVVLYLFTDWSLFRLFELKHPLGLVLASIIIIIFLSGWKGLTLQEYFLFKKTIKHVELSEEK